jgi:hypothetical protein
MGTWLAKMRADFSTLTVRALHRQLAPTDVRARRRCTKTQKAAFSALAARRAAHYGFGNA